MTAPRLNTALLLETPERVSDGAGGFTEGWVALGTLWAEVRPGTGRSAGENGLPLSRVPLKITVRAAPQNAPSRPHAGQRFRDGTRVYAIRSVTEADAAGRYLICQTEEETAA